MAQNLGDNVTIYDYYAKNGYISGYVNGGGKTEFTSYTLIANQSMTLTGRVRALSDDATLPATPVFQAPKIIINNTGSIGILIRSDNPNNSMTFNDSSVNFDNAIYNGNNAANRIGPISFTGTSSINITSNTNGKTIIKASTLTGTVTLDVEDGVQDGDTFLIEATDNQLVITDGEWSATASTSGNVTTYTLAKSEPVPVPVIGKYNKKLLRKKLALMLANLKKPRKYYCEVEYLEGTGTQYIDTGLDYFADFEVGIQLRTSVSNKALGNGAFYCMQRYNQANPYWYFSTGTGASNSYITSTPITEHHIMKWKDNKIYSDGVLLTDFTKDSNAPNRMYLYSGDGSNKYPNMIYFCKLWNPDNGELVRDFIPVLDWNMKPCLFDRVTEQLFYNQATSGNDFSYGREIHYVDYLESTGTQYINTGLLSTASSTVDTEFDFTSMESGVANNVGVFGGRNATTTNTFTFFKIASGNPQYFRFDYNSQTTVGTASEMTWDTASKYRFQYNGTNCITTNTTTGESVVTPRSPASTFTQYPIHLFAVNTAGAIGLYLSGRIYYYKYSDGTKSVDMVPAIDENGVGYMLDRVGHTIYDNAGTGAFGYSGREVEYLQSDGARAIIAGVTVDDTCGYDVKWMALNSNDTIILGTKGSGDSRWVLSGSNNPNVNISWNTSSGGIGLGLNKIQTAQMNYLNDRKRILNDTPLTDITQTLSANASTYSVGIFGGYWGASSISLYSTCRIYYAKISKGTGLVRDFVPMFKDGSPCLFDKIGGMYYFGTGTGTFTTGKIVEPEYE